MLEEVSEILGALLLLARRHAPSGRWCARLVNAAVPLAGALIVAGCCAWMWLLPALELAGGDYMLMLCLWSGEPPWKETSGHVIGTSGQSLFGPENLLRAAGGGVLKASRSLSRRMQHAIRVWQWLAERAWRSCGSARLPRRHGHVGSWGRPSIPQIHISPYDTYDI